MSSRHTILVVEDEASFVEALTIALSREGFQVAVATDGAMALEMFDAGQTRRGAAGPDAATCLGNRCLPADSPDVSKVPIIIVTAKSSEIDTVVGLEVGADDYVSKPYRMRELVARIRAVMRRLAIDDTRRSRSSPSSHQPCALAAVTLDPDEHLVTVDGRLLPCR